MAPQERSLFFFFRKSRETSSSGVLSLLSQDVEKNFYPEFGHTCSQWSQSCNRFWNTKESWTLLIRLRSFDAWSTPRFMIELIPHAFFMPISLTHLLPPFFYPSTQHYSCPPIFCVCVWYKKTKKKQKNKILYGNVIQYSIGHIIL